MTSIWALAALWLGLALIASLLSIWLRVSTALSEIIVGTIAQLIIGAVVGAAVLGTDETWIQCSAHAVRRAIKLRQHAKSPTKRVPLAMVVGVGTGVGVISEENALRRAVMVTVPATVPVCSGISGVLSEPAGMVTCRVRPPDANCTAGSSGPLSAAKVRVRVTFTGAG